MKRLAVFRLSKRCSCGRDIALRHWVSAWPFDWTSLEIPVETRPLTELFYSPDRMCLLCGTSCVFKNNSG